MSRRLPAPDCQPNGVEDVCEIVEGTAADCNGNGVPDECDIESGASGDCNVNDIPDECDPDCNGNAVADECEPDSDADGVIDECDGCPFDPDKTSPGPCGCGSPDDDDDGDGVLNCDDRCPGVDDAVFGPCAGNAIPAVSTWGVIIVTLSLLAAGKVCFGRRAEE